MKKILVVEDEVRGLTVIRKGLMRRGYEIEVAANGREAIDKGRDFEPDVLLTDWLLKGEQNGLTVAEALRAWYPKLIVIFFSGLPMEKIQAAAGHLHPCTYLEKPFGLGKLEATIEAALQSAGPE
jgi:DNA-binding response OmpR family regulator